MQETKEYTYYNVAVEPAFDAQQYHYLADETYRVGEYVVVPFGRRQLLGIVSEIKYCTEKDAPYPPEKTKKILHKATDDEIRGKPAPGEEIDDTDDSSWTEKTLPQIAIRGKLVEITPLELKIIRWLQNDTNMHPLRNIQRRYPKYPTKTIENSLEHLRKLGILQGGDWLAGNMYYLADNIHIGGGNMRSKAFTKLETIFRNATQEEIEGQALESASVLDTTLGSLGLEDTVYAILVIAKYGTGHEGELSEREKHLVHVLFDYEDNYADVEKMCSVMGAIPLNSAFAAIQQLCTSLFVGMDVLLLILSFAYIDGGLDDVTAENLNRLFDEASLEAVIVAAQIGKANAPVKKENADKQHKGGTVPEKPNKSLDENKKSAGSTQTQKNPPKLTQDEERAIYQSKLKKWKTECDKIRTQRREMVDAQLRKEQSQLEDALKRKNDAELHEQQEKLKKYQDQKAEAERELASLGVFKFSEKKAKKAQIEYAENRIAESKTHIERAKQEYRTKLAALKDDAKRKESQFRSEAEKKFPFPCEPPKPDFVQQEEIAAVGERIVDEMEIGGAYTLSDMMHFKCLAGMELTTAKVRGFLNAPLDAHRIEKSVVKGRVVYSLT